MLKRFFTITLLCLPFYFLQAEESTSVTYQAWKSTLDSTYSKPIHYLGLGAKVGYSQFAMPGINKADGVNFRFPGGANAGLEVRYKLEYHALRFTAGIDFAYAGSSAKAEFMIPRGISYPDESMTYKYNFRNLREQQNALEVGVPLMLGANIYKGIYAQAGMRLGVPVMGTFSTNTDIERTIDDAKAIDEFTDMENHGLYLDNVSNSGKLNLNMLNPQVAMEVGFNLDPWLAYHSSKRRRGRNKGPEFKELLHYEVALYANVGVMDYRKDANAEFYKMTDEGKIGAVKDLSSITQVQDFADSKLIPWNVGVRFNVYYEFYDKPKKPRKPKVRKPKEQPVVVQDTVAEIIPPVVEDVPPVTVGDTIVMENLYFDVDKTNIQTASEESLDKLADLLEEYDFTITLVGHTDNTATPAYNQKLSENRVRTVKAELVKRGIEANRIKTIGKGQTEPIADNSTPEGRQKNRRVEVIFE